MSLFKRLLKALTGQNGFDPKQHEAQVQQLKDETILSWESVGKKLDDIQTKFRETEEGLKKGPSKA
jgi:hypothetical protein